MLSIKNNKNVICSLLFSTKIYAAAQSVNDGCNISERLK